MAPKVRFQEGERVLCFHGPLLYEAKCMKSMVKDKVLKHFIHYSGWKKSWDEWVPETRVLKFNEANLQKQKELEKQHSSAVKKGKLMKATGPPGKKKEGGEKERSSTPTIEKQLQKAKVATAVTSSQESPGSNSGDILKKKRSRVDPTVESEETFLARVEVKVKIPDELKPWLVDDWDLITRQKKVFQLPARVTVDQIIADYTKFKQTAKNNTPNRESTVIEVTNGIKEYFNVMLGTQLLYKFERIQYGEILAAHPDTPMSSVYGSIHLLRLFVKLGGMLAYTPLDERNVQLLLLNIQDFLRYLHKNSNALFSLNDYGVASPEYHRKAL